MLTEADAHGAFLAGARAPVIRLAPAVTRALGRKGRVCGGRYHAQALRTPREVRQALVSVINNRQKRAEGPL